MKKAIAIGVLLVALSLLAYFLEIRPSRRPDPTVRGSGTIEATPVLVSAKIAARLLSVNARDGEQVKAGHVLATLDCRELEARKAQALARVSQARAALAQSRAALAQARAGHGQARSQIRPLVERREQAHRDYERMRSLVASGSLPQSQLERAETALKALIRHVAAAQAGAKVASRGSGVAAESIRVMESALKVAIAALGLTEVAIDECRLKAPIDGVVAARNYEPGELVLPGATLFRLHHLDQVYTWIYVANAELGRVHLNQDVAVSADTYPQRLFKGRVVRIREQAEFTPKSIQTKEDRTRLVFGVKVMLENSDHALLPGMPVEAALAPTKP